MLMSACEFTWMLLTYLSPGVFSERRGKGVEQWGTNEVTRPLFV
jgi:hypothetical protein